jgi:protein-tyrosine-phosphatase
MADEVFDNGDGAVSPRPRYRSVLFICAANTARSVMAEYIMKRELEQRGLHQEVVVRSAGIAPYARDGSLVSLDTRITLREDGIDISDEAKSMALRRHPEFLQEADLILAMTEKQALELRANFMGDSERPIYTLREFAGDQGDIEDPWLEGLEVWVACREEIKRLIPLVIERMTEEPQTNAQSK